MIIFTDPCPVPSASEIIKAVKVFIDIVLDDSERDKGKQPFLFPLRLKEPFKAYKTTQEQTLFPSIKMVVKQIAVLCKNCCNFAAANLNT